MKNRPHKIEVTYQRGRVKEGSNEGEYGSYTSYTRVNIEFLSQLKPP
jgi:hypothetical protein